MPIAYVGLGGNLSDPKQQIETAIVELNHLPNTSLTKISRLYQTKPVGYLNQPDFINAVAELDTSLSPCELLKGLQEIESKHLRKRDKSLRNGPRTLDLDVLLYDKLMLEAPMLTIPHPRMYQRQFVLEPLFEIAPDLLLPDGTSLKTKLEELEGKSAF